MDALDNSDVYLSFSTNMGEKLCDYADMGPLWVTDSAAHRIAAQKAVKQCAYAIALFLWEPSLTLREQLTRQVQLIHAQCARHGYRYLNVLGAGLAQVDFDAMQAFGFRAYFVADDGFIADRPRCRPMAEGCAEDSRRITLSLQCPAFLSRGDEETFRAWLLQGVPSVPMMMRHSTPLKLM